MCFLDVVEKKKSRNSNRHVHEHCSLDVTRITETGHLKKVATMYILLKWDSCGKVYARSVKWHFRKLKEVIFKFSGCVY